MDGQQPTEEATWNARFAWPILEIAVRPLKSVGINAMILSLLYKNSPDELRLVMIDPKMLEFSMYDGIPHLFDPCYHKTEASD